MKKVLTVIILTLVSFGIAYAGPMEIPQGSKCHLCGMKVDPASAYSAQVVESGGILPFCDIGDMLHYYNKQKEKPDELYVRDMQSGEWIDASKAIYVKNEKFSTPMEWGIAALSNREEAAKFGRPMSFGEALNAVK